MTAYQGEALTALADPTRRSIFELLQLGPRPVSDLAAHVPISRPAVSQHLKVLKDAGLVSVTTRGTRHVYRLDPAGLAEIRAYLDQFWTVALSSFAEAAETEAAETQAVEAQRSHDPDHTEPIGETT